MPELIDRDDLMRKHTTSMLHNNRHNTVDELKVLLRLISEAPVIDASPVVHGHWIVKEKMGKLICSNCGKGINAMGEMQIILTKEHERYCYHCGAKMEN